MDAKIQVDAARRAALAVPHLDLAILVVTGEDRRSWLNGLLTCNLTQIAPNRAAYGLAVARSGRVLSDATVVDDPDAHRLLVAVPRAAAASLLAHLEHYLVMEDAELHAEIDGFDTWLVHGPAARDVLESALAAGAVGGELDRTGLGGAIVVAPRDGAPSVRVAIERSVAAIGGVMGDDPGWEALRLERAVPSFGIDFDETMYPQEAGLEKAAVSFDKGCYLGQEVVCMLELRGHVKRKLVPILLDASKPPERGAAVSDATGTQVGTLSSAAWSPTHARVAGLAMLKRAFAAPGSQVRVAGIAAQVVERSSLVDSPPKPPLC